MFGLQAVTFYFSNYIKIVVFLLGVYYIIVLYLFQQKGLMLST